MNEPSRPTGKAAIETNRLRLREYLQGDVDQRAAMFADEETMRYYPRTKTGDETADWIDWNLRSYERHGFGLWVVELKTGEFIGDCGLVVQIVDGVREIELGYSIKRSIGGRASPPRRPSLVGTTLSRSWVSAVSYRSFLRTTCPLRPSPERSA